MPMNESGMAMVSAAALFLVLKFVKYTQDTARPARLEYG